MKAAEHAAAAEPTFWAAPNIAKAGYPVFPVTPGDKHPSVEGGFYAGTTDVSEIAAWIEGGRADHNIAIPTGIPSQVVVIEADSAEAYAEMQARHGAPTVKTRRGGHWYMRHPRNGKVVSNKVADGLDRKGDGGYVLVPPSLGRTWTHGIPRLRDLPVLPERFWTKRAEKSDAARSMPQEQKARAAEVIADHVRRIEPGPDKGRHEHLRHLSGVLLSRGVGFGDAEDILVAAWEREGGELAERAAKEVPNTLRTTEQALAEDRATGVPKMEEITPGLYAELEEIFGWKTIITFGGRSKGRREPAKSAPWPELAEEALYGLPGEFVRAVEPHTEADPVAVLANLLCAFGNVVGRGAFARVGGDEHHLKLFVGLVGETAKGRKGVSWGAVRPSLEAVDPAWAVDRVVGGLSSGEGLIHAVRDEVRGLRKDEEVILDAGESDKRLLAMEGELAGLLKVMAREGNTLSPVIRQAWDGGRLRTLTKNNPTKSTGAHISIVGHVTRTELLRHMGETEAANGFANRFLWLMVRRSKQLPFGGGTPDLSRLQDRLRSVVRFGRRPLVIGWGESSKDPWSEVYGPLSEGKPGLFGAVVGRGEAQALRLAALYAVLDGSETIEFDHLAAALALWDYAEQSARYVFGDATGDPVADDIMEALRAAEGVGLTRTELRDLFGRHKSADRINQALGELLRLGRVRKETEQTGGRPTERWYAG